HLRQSVRDILLTPQGSRIARREYGSLLSALIDQPQNPALRLQVMSAVYVALSGQRNNGVPVSLSVSTGAENGSD
ncbi:TPA: baseplate assembly protein, partial [Escherichia coli]